MNFNTNNNGVFEPAQPSAGEKKVNPIIARGGNRRPLPPVHGISPDVIGMAAIAVEIILLYLFRDAIFYNIIQPVLVLIADIIAVVLYIASLAAAAFLSFRSIIAKHRNKNRRRW